MLDKNKVAGRLKELRDNAKPKMSQSGLAQKLNDLIGYNNGGVMNLDGETGKQTVSQLERATRGITLDLAFAYAHIFGVSLDYVLGKSDDWQPSYKGIKDVTGLPDEAVRGLKTLWENENRKRNNKAKDRQDPFVNAHAALKKLLSQKFNSTAIPGLVVLSYINLYLESEGTADINDYAYDIAGLSEEDVALTAITKALTSLKRSNREG
jgi:transcriptional regulator with XRE-family HTH domain